MKKAAMKERVRCLSIVRQWLDDQFDASDKEECEAKVLWESLAGSGAVYRDGTRKGITRIKDLEEKYLLQEVGFSEKLIRQGAVLYREQKRNSDQADEITRVRSRNGLLMDDLVQAKAAIGALEEQVSKLEGELNDARGITEAEADNEKLRGEVRALEWGFTVLEANNEGLRDEIKKLKLRVTVDTDPDRKLITFSRCECGSDSDHMGSLLCYICGGCGGARGLY